MVTVIAHILIWGPLIICVVLFPCIPDVLIAIAKNKEKNREGKNKSEDILELKLALAASQEENSILKRLNRG